MWYSCGMTTTEGCVIPNCTEDHYSRGLCRRDYGRFSQGRLAEEYLSLMKPARTRTIPYGVCANCDKEFKATRQQAARASQGRKVYCSRECQKATHWTEVVCAGCGKTVAREKHMVEKNATDRFFCSAECRNKVGSKPKTGRYITCEIGGCDNPIWVKVSEAGRKRFCSNDCKNKADRKRDERTCPECGGEFVVTPSSGAKYCSMDCSAIARRAKVGHRYIDPEGYAWLYVDDGTGTGRAMKVSEHRYVMEQHLGRPLFTWETVHHKDDGFRGRSDNRLEHLEHWASHHPRGHRITDIVDYCYEMLSLYGTVEEQANYAAHKPSYERGTEEDA